MIWKDDDILGIVAPTSASIAGDAVKYYFEEPQYDGWVDVEYGSFAEAKAANEARRKQRESERPDARMAAAQVLRLPADHPERRRIDAIRINDEED